MSTLPDIDTTTISYVTYWNAIDHGGVGSIDPEEALTDNNINSYTLYDNGIDIDSYTYRGIDLHARLKTDGWIIAWLDRTENTGQTTGAPLIGPWQIADYINVNDQNSSLTNNRLERSVNSLASNLDNFGSMTYNEADVSLYNYEHPDASATTMMSTEGTGHTSRTAAGGFSYSSSTTIFGAWAYACCSYSNDATLKADFEGTTYMSHFETNNGKGALDILANGLIPDSGTEYNAYHTIESTAEKVHTTVIVLWD